MPSPKENVYTCKEGNSMKKYSWNGSQGVGNLGGGASGPPIRLHRFQIRVIFPSRNDQLLRDPGNSLVASHYLGWLYTPRFSAIFYYRKKNCCDFSVCFWWRVYPKREDSAAHWAYSFINRVDPQLVGEIVAKVASLHKFLFPFSSLPLKQKS